MSYTTRRILEQYGHVITFALAILFVVLILAVTFSAHAEEQRPVASNEATFAFANGAYIGAVTGIALKLQVIGVPRDKSFAMAQHCAGTAESVVTEAAQYVSKDDPLRVFGLAITIVAYERCGLLEEARS